MPARPRRRQSAAPSRAIWPSLVVIAAALAALDVIVFAQTAHHAFITLDDNEYITDNLVVQRGLTAAGAWWALTTGHFPYWHPLTWISHMLDVQWFGLNAGPHHLTSVAIHVANTVLLFLGLHALTGSRGRSAFVAALFGVHPLHVESVAWIAERKDVLSTLCWWLTIGAYISYVRRPAWWRYALIAAALTLGLMAKPMLVTVPVVLLLLDVWPLGRWPAGRGAARWWPLVTEKLPFAALAAASAVVTVLVQEHVGAVISISALPLAVRATHPFVSYFAYLRDAAWPAGLSAYYPYPNAPSAAAGVTAAIALAALTAVAVRLAPRLPYITAGWLWYVITLVPVIGFVQAGSQARADRFTYVPLVGIFVIVAWGVPDLLRAAAGGRRALWQPRVLGAAALAIVLACAVTAHAQAAYWQDSVTLWHHALDVDPANFLARGSLGAVDLERGDLDAAGREYAEAVRLKPGYLSAQCNLGLILTAQGHLDEAVAHFRLALAIDPDQPDALVGLGAIDASRGQVDEAIGRYRNAIAARPSMATAHLRLGLALAVQGHVPEALTEFSTVIALKPALTAAWTARAATLANIGRRDEAIADYRQALRLNPNDERTRRALLALGVRGDERE